VPLSERLKTGELIGPTNDEQLTLVTCWPYGVDDHRLIVIARPAP
jgi:sortase A